ncbi:MAG TPA: hypothetical protein PK910_09385, partial [Bacteroidales bacterium]|nr:hypothetical protein [Bacteroidales bacterium]
GFEPTRLLPRRLSLHGRSNKHINFPSFFLPSPLGLRTTPFKMSLNNLMVVESTINTSLNVSPEAWLSD